MAINPLISLQSRVPDVGATFSNALLNVGRLEDLKRGREEAPLRSRLLEAQTSTAEAAVPTKQEQFDTAQQNKIKSLATGASEILPSLQSGDIKGTIATLQKRSVALEAAGIDNSDTLEAIQLAQTNPQALIQASQQAIDLSQQISPAEVSEVQSSKILPGGLVQIVRKDGTTEVLPESEANTELVRTAEERGAELQGLRSQERETGKGAAKIALDSFDRVGKIRENILDLQEGIRLVRDEGAQTGPIAARFPSVKAASVKLDQLQKKLGLNVVGAVTFGALSKGELDLAKDVALPKNLNEVEIVGWMEARIAAQEKLANNLEDAALFLAEPGNTVAGFIRSNREKAAQSQASPQGLPQGVTEEDIATTMQANNMTREQVLQRLGAQ